MALNGYFCPELSTLPGRLVELLVYEILYPLKATKMIGPLFHQRKMVNLFATFCRNVLHWPTSLGCEFVNVLSMKVRIDIENFVPH